MLSKPAPDFCNDTASSEALLTLVIVWSLAFVGVETDCMHFAGWFAFDIEALRVCDGDMFMRVGF